MRATSSVYYTDSFTLAPAIEVYDASEGDGVILYTFELVGGSLGWTVRRTETIRCASHSDPFAEAEQPASCRACRIALEG